MRYNPSIVKPRPKLLFAVLFAVSTAAQTLVAAPKPSGALIREPGAIYLEDFVQKPVRVQLLGPAPIFAQSDRQRSLGVLRPGQAVEIQAVSDGLYRVRGQAQQGQVAGWIDPNFLTPLKPEFLDTLRQNAARRAEVEALIARNEVAINMTPEEVSSALGKPSKKTSRIDAAGREDVWEFVRYERVAQSSVGRDIYGRTVTNVYYVKVPAGKLSVVFSGNLVTSMEQSEGTTDAARAKIVVAPLVSTF